MKIAGVIIYRNLAYVPTSAQMKSGPYLDISPVQVTPLNVESLGQALKVAFEEGNRQIDDVNYKEYKKSDPILKKTGARSWAQLARDGASYGIQWVDKSIDISISKLDGKGRFVTDLSKTKQLPYGSSTYDIAKVILDDWQSR